MNKKPITKVTAEKVSRKAKAIFATKTEVEASVTIAPLSEVDKLFPGIDING